MSSLKIKLSPKLFDLLQHCELKCSAGCCGWGAFDLSDRWLTRWCEFRDANVIAEARKDIARIREIVDGLDTVAKINLEPFFDPTVATLSQHFDIIDDLLSSYSNK
jgi:hypothetical protein